MPRFSRRGQLNLHATKEKIKERKRKYIEWDILAWHARYAKRKLIVAFMEQVRQDIESQIGDDQGHDSNNLVILECIVCVLIFGLRRLVSTGSLTDITVPAPRLLHMLPDDRARDTLVLFNLTCCGRVMAESNSALFFTGIPAALPFLSIYDRAPRLLLDMDGADAEKRRYYPYAATMEGRTASSILPHWIWMAPMQRSRCALHIIYHREEWQVSNPVVLP
jgi:hypothetical protein